MYEFLDESCCDSEAIDQILGLLFVKEVARNPRTAFRKFDCSPDGSMDVIEKSLEGVIFAFARYADQGKGICPVSTNT